MTQLSDEYIFIGSDDGIESVNSGHMQTEIGKESDSRQ